LTKFPYLTVAGAVALASAVSCVSPTVEGEDGEQPARADEALQRWMSISLKGLPECNEIETDCDYRLEAELTSQNGQKSSSAAAILGGKNAHHWQTARVVLPEGASSGTLELHVFQGTFIDRATKPFPNQAESPPPKWRNLRMIKAATIPLAAEKFSQQPDLSRGLTVRVKFWPLSGDAVVQRVPADLPPVRRRRRRRAP
jgi:hypothetical protein